MLNEPKNVNDTEPLFDEFEWQIIASHLQIPERQVQVLRGVFDGMSDSEIAERLGVTLATERLHLSLLFERMGVGDRTSLVIQVFRSFQAISDTTGRE